MSTSIDTTHHDSGGTTSSNKREPAVKGRSLRRRKPFEEITKQRILGRTQEYIGETLGINGRYERGSQGLGNSES